MKKKMSGMAVELKFLRISTVRNILLKWRGGCRSLYQKWGRKERAWPWMYVKCAVFWIFQRLTCCENIALYSKPSYYSRDVLPFHPHFPSGARTRFLCAGFTSTSIRIALSKNNFVNISFTQIVGPVVEASAELLRPPREQRMIK